MKNRKKWHQNINIFALFLVKYQCVFWSAGYILPVLKPHVGLLNLDLIEDEILCVDNMDMRQWFHGNHSFFLLNGCIWLFFYFKNDILCENSMDVTEWIILKPDTNSNFT